MIVLFTVGPTESSTTGYPETSTDIDTSTTGTTNVSESSSTTTIISSTEEQDEDITNATEDYDIEATTLDPSENEIDTGK